MLLTFIGALSLTHAMYQQNSMAINDNPQENRKISLNNKKELRSYIKTMPLSHHITAITVGYSITDNELEQLVNASSHITSLELNDCEVLLNFNPIGNLQNLTHLKLALCRNIQDINFLSGLPLTHLALRSFMDLSEYPATHPARLQLKHLSDLTPLLHLRNLTFLDLSYSSISNLNIIGLLTNLTHLTLLECRQLHDIKGLTGLNKLTYLDLNCCLKLRDISYLSALTNLTFLRLMYCCELKEIEPLKRLISLTELDLRHTGLGNKNNVDELSKCLPKAYINYSLY